MSYLSYLQSKSDSGEYSGFDPIYMPKELQDFQMFLVDWSVRKGRAGLFSDCGTGKSFMELVWAANIVRKTNGNVIICTPIAVGEQMRLEAEKFNIDDVTRSRDGKIRSKITITNYEMLHLFDSNDFDGFVGDESSILKNFKGARKAEITIFARKIKYRLLATATAAPNDFIELGTSSEALGYMGYMDMLSMFFKNDQNNCATNRRGRFTEATKWRLKGHAHSSFWRWVTSWARAIRKPSDIGFSDNGYDLPPLIENAHKLDISRNPNPGELFTFAANGLNEVRDERRATIRERCEFAANLVNNKQGASVSWCNLNDEGDLLTELIDGAVQVSGKDCDEKKEDKLIAFTKGEIEKLVIKPKIGAWGLNWQHCCHTTFFPAYSYEQYYQAIRRFLRFGQVESVECDLIYTQGDNNSMTNLRRKQKQADEMFTALVKEMNNPLNINNITSFKNKMETPKWA